MHGMGNPASHCIDACLILVDRRVTCDVTLVPGATTQWCRDGPSITSVNSCKVTISFSSSCQNTHNTMDTPWPQWLVNSFLSANQPLLATDESAYYGPYTRLLYHLFGLEGPFEISPQYHIPQTSRDVSDVVALFTVELDKHPVLFIEVKPPASFALDSKRKQADDQMRDRFHDLRHNLLTPRLPGISAFGTRMAFYEYEAASNTLMPRLIIPDPVALNDVAPAERWNYDLLEPNGIVQMCRWPKMSRRCVRP